MGYNTETMREYMRQYRAKAPKRRYKYKLAKYGYTQELFDEKLVEQRGLCAICSKTPSGGRGNGWRPDHDHSTGLARGLLCNNCNLLLGHAKDDPEILRKAIDYLQKHRGCGKL